MWYHFSYTVFRNFVGPLQNLKLQTSAWFAVLRPCISGNLAWFWRAVCSSVPERCIFPKLAYFCEVAHPRTILKESEYAVADG